MCLLFYFVLSKPIQPFLRALTPSVLLLPESGSLPTVLCLTPRSAVRDFILESETRAIRGKGIGKATPRLSVIGRRKGGVFTRCLPHITKNTPVRECSASPTIAVSMQPLPSLLSEEAQLTECLCASLHRQRTLISLNSTCSVLQ